MFAVEMVDITKRYPGTVANNRVDFRARRGTVHALLGENGAGKSTLMNVLYGLSRPDGGEIRVEGTARTVSAPSDAIALGIGMVHQHFMLIPAMTVAENIVLGSEPVRRGVMFDRHGAFETLSRLCRDYRIDVDLAAPVSALPIGLQQKVEILKVLYRNARILILDEPTGVLVPHEVSQLFATLRELSAAGATVIMITHKLPEVRELADDLTVLRQGKAVLSGPAGDFTDDELTRAMVGRDIHRLAAPPPRSPGEGVLTVKGLTVRSGRGRAALSGIDLEVRAGEIFGIAGVEGNGQSALMEVLAGLRPFDGGTVSIAGAPPSRRHRAAAHIPEDRQTRGLVLDFSVKENLLLGNHRFGRYQRAFVQRTRAVHADALRAVEEYGITPPDVELPARSLSGGNQQKVVLARELGRAATLVLASQPTRGLDVGATEFVHRRLLRERDAGKAVLLVSSDTEELLLLSDRLAVMYGGAIVARFDGRGCSEEELGPYMVGSRGT